MHFQVLKTEQTDQRMNANEQVNVRSKQPNINQRTKRKNDKIRLQKQQMQNGDHYL